MVTVSFVQARITLKKTDTEQALRRHMALSPLVDSIPRGSMEIVQSPFNSANLMQNSSWSEFNR